MSVKFLTHTPEGGESAEFIEVTFAPVAPGSVADVMFRPATDEDRERYRAAYRAFKGEPAKVVKPEPVEVKPSGLFKSHKKG